MGRKSSRWKIRRMLADRVRAIEKRNPWITLTTNDILDLHDAVRPCIEVPGLSAERLADMPVCVGNVTLRAMSPGAMLWYVEFGLPWFEGEPKLRGWLLPFVLAHSRQKLFDLYPERDKARRALRRWVKTVSCSNEALQAGVDTLLDLDPDAEASDEDRDPLNMSPMMAFMVREFGGTFEHWFWEVPFAQCILLIDEYNEKQRQQHRDPKKIDPTDPRFIAQKHLIDTTRKIIARHADEKTDDAAGSPDAVLPAE
jgi:hypothetical protein